MARDPYQPKRRQTKPLPRASLPPPASSVPDLVNAREWDPDAQTLEECPRCKHCPLCEGKLLVSQEVAKKYRESEG